MDIVTHGLAGALVARAGFEQRVRRVATAALVVGALLPDVDVVLGFWDQMAAIRYHRGLTHSVFGGVPLALAAAWPIWRLVRGVRFLHIAGLVYLGILVHIGLDLPTSFGTMALAPLSWRRFALDWVFIVDFVLSGIVATGLLLGQVWRGLRTPIARMALAGLALYLGVAGLGHLGAVRGWGAWLEGRGLRPQSVAAVPVLGSPLIWKGLAETDEALYEGAIAVFPGGNLEPVRYAKPEGNAFIARAEGVAEVEVYRAFARFLWVRYLREGLNHIVEFTDLRYGSRREINGMTLQVVLDGSASVRAVNFNHRF
jgi:inner membrane protein